LTLSRLLDLTYHVSGSNHRGLRQKYANILDQHASKDAVFRRAATKITINVIGKSFATQYHAEDALIGAGFPIVEPFPLEPFIETAVSQYDKRQMH
jgi:hypothetical protein